jgi:chromosome segregation ATPase
MASRPATTDDLAQLEASLRGDVEKLDGKIEKLDGKIVELDGKFEKLDGKFEKLDGRVSRLEGRVDRVEAKLDQVDAKVDKVDAKVDRVEARLAGDMAGMEQRLIAHIADASVHTAEVVAQRLYQQLAQHTAASAEETRNWVRALDDKYSRLPDEIVGLRREVDARCPPPSDPIIPDDDV